MCGNVRPGPHTGCRAPSRARPDGVNVEARAPQPRVGVIMGSDSDWSVMEDAAQALAEFDVPFEVGVVFAHRTQAAACLDYARTAAEQRHRGHLVAEQAARRTFPAWSPSATPLPVIGVPVPLAKLDGLDSLLSVVQMPAGVPVATVSIGGATRDCWRCAVLGTSDVALRTRMEGEYREHLGRSMVLQMMRRCETGCSGSSAANRAAKPRSIPQARKTSCRAISFRPSRTSTYRQMVRRPAGACPAEG